MFTSKLGGFGTSTCKLYDSLCLSYFCGVSSVGIHTLCVHGCLSQLGNIVYILFLVFVMLVSVCG